MTQHSFTFEQAGIVGRVSIDGHDISSAVRSLRFDGDAGMHPRVILDLHIHDVTTVSSDGTEVLIPDVTAEALIVLGWTPPPGHLRSSEA
jgi:hypothetical protein